MQIAETYSLNQWPVQSFRRQVDKDVLAEVRIVTAYDTPICLTTIRAAVISDILFCAMPAGNA